MSTTLSRPPSTAALTLKAATTLLRRPDGKPAIPPLSVRLDGQRAPSEQLAAYRELCGFGDSRTLPITFPHIMAAGMLLHLLTRPEFPLPLLGLVHFRNRIEQTRGIGTGEALDFELSIGEAREVRQGLEFDLITRVTADGEEVWREVMTNLYRLPAPKSKAAPPPPPPARLAEYLPFSAPADIGRRYAAIGKDYNPIHLAPLPAKLFGFPRHIAHGMWTLACCAAQLGERLDHEPKRLDVAFRQPLLLPGRATLKFTHAEALPPAAVGGAVPAGFDFELLSARDGRVHLQGVLR